jgi:hypothetical protein
LIESFKPVGLCELWRDKLFISPHLGILSNVDEDLAENFLVNNCFEKLAIYVRPIYNNKKGLKTILSIVINEMNFTYDIKHNDIYCYYAEKKLNIEFIYHVECSVCEKAVVLEPNTCLIIDTRSIDANNYEKLILDTLQPYSFQHENQINKRFPVNKDLLKDINTNSKEKHFSLCFSLPYPGGIFVKLGDDVLPETVIAENKFEPPKIYVILISSMVQLRLAELDVKTGLLVKIGDTISVGCKIFSINSKDFISTSVHTAYSPVRGIVENINYSTGTIIVREIQDYPLTPVTISASELIGIKEKDFKYSLKRKAGDFVFAGDTLVKNLSADYKFLASPYTGTIQNIDFSKCALTICYDKKPFSMMSNCYGKVIDIKDDKDVYIQFKAIKLEGKVGFGGDISGILHTHNVASNFMEIFNDVDSKIYEQSFKDKIVFINHISYTELITFSKLGIKGLICCTISYRCLATFIGKDIGVVLTGNESLPFSLILINGFANNLKCSDNYTAISNNEIL